MSEESEPPSRDLAATRAGSATCRLPSWPTSNMHGTREIDPAQARQPAIKSNIKPGYDGRRRILFNRQLVDPQLVIIQPVAEEPGRRSREESATVIMPVSRSACQYSLIKQVARQWLISSPVVRADGPVNRIGGTSSTWCPWAEGSLAVNTFDTPHDALPFESQPAMPVTTTNVADDTSRFAADGGNSE